jgi:hypothetical protein
MNNLKISDEIAEFIKIYIPCAPHRTKKDIAIPLISLPQ